MARLNNLRLHGLGEECDDPVAAAIESFARPAPGVPGIEAVVHAASLDGDDVLVDVELDPKGYLSQCHALGLDDLETLDDLKSAGLSGAELAGLVQWLKGDPELFTVQLNSRGGKLRVDRYPSKPNI